MTAQMDPKTHKANIRLAIILALTAFGFYLTMLLFNRQ